MGVKSLAIDDCRLVSRLYLSVQSGRSVRKDRLRVAMPELPIVNEHRTIQLIAEPINALVVNRQ
jgi:hypothetical protein